MLKTYYYLTKPGIIYGNAITASAGFFLASKGHPNFALLIAMLAGLSLVIASACVFNNFFDRDIDERMERTKNRAFVQKSILTSHGVIYGLMLGIIGALILYFYTNLLTFYIGLVGFIVYLAFYTPLKRRSVHATLVGSISGATPPVAGYAAVTHHLDLGAWLLFFILVTWQMPHFYAIAIRRLEEYKAASIPALPVIKGVRHTKITIMIYIIIYIMIVSLFTIYGYLGYLFLGINLIVALNWLSLAVRGFSATDNPLWAEKLFKVSLLILLTFCLTVSLDAIIFA